jgi:peptidyl-prolyl cis-trans isomerase SurA
MLAAAVLAMAAAAPQMLAQGTGQTLDRVVASVGDTAITASDVEAEYRLELFLDGKAPEGPEPSDAVLDQVRQRMIDRILLEEEVHADGIRASPDDQAVQARFADLQRKFQGAEGFQRALKDVGMSESDLREALAEQEEILRLIDHRLRPEAIVEPAEIDSYYRNSLLPDLARQGNQQAPLLDQVEGRIREILVQQKIDGLLEDWLKRLRARSDVHVSGNASVNGTP